MNKNSLYLKSPGQELVLDLQKVSSVHLTLEGFIENGKFYIILNILPPSITMSENKKLKAYIQPNRHLQRLGISMAAIYTTALCM